jgi:hypothetical protein
LVGRGDRCPRCGLVISWVERVRRGDRVYYVAAHSSGGGKRARRCYLGPEEYVYVSKLHEDLGLTLRGALERDRWVDYMASLVEAIASQDDRSRAVDILRRVREAVDDALRSLGAGGAGCGEILGKIVKVLEDAEAYASLASSLEGHEGDILECVVRDAGEALKRVVEARELLNRYIECIGGVK